MCFESAFPLVALPDADIVVAPSNIKFTEYLHALEILDALGQVGQWCYIFSGDCVQGLVVNDIALFVTVLLCNKKVLNPYGELEGTM